MRLPYLYSLPFIIFLKESRKKDCRKQLVMCFCVHVIVVSYFTDAGITYKTTSEVYLAVHCAYFELYAGIVRYLIPTL